MFLFFSQRGVSLFFVIIILSIVLSVALGLSAVLVNQIKMIRGVEDSVVAFYAADTGIEQGLKEAMDGANPSFLGTLDNTADYTVETKLGTCPLCTIRAVGSYNNVKRAMEVLIGN